MNEWISINDEQFHRKIQHPYLIYGRQLHSHWPGKDIAIWDGSVWYKYDDDTHVYRDGEIDFYMDVLYIEDPK